MVKQTSSLFSSPSLVLSTRKQSQGLSVRGEGKRGGGYLRGKMKFLWQGSCYDPCLAPQRGLAWLAKPLSRLGPLIWAWGKQPWSSLAPEQKKSIKNKTFVCFLGQRFDDRIPSGGEGPRARSLTFLFDFQPWLLPSPALGSSALAKRWTWGFGGESLGLFL